MKSISVSFIASQLNIFSKKVDEINKMAYAKELIRTVIDILNYRDGDNVEYLYDIAAQLERDLETPVVTDLLLNLYRDLKTYASQNGWDNRICFKVIEIGSEFFAVMDLDLTFTSMKRNEEFVKNIVDVESVIENPNAEQLEKIIVSKF